LRQELSYFDFTRDPRLADLTLVVVRQPAGNGGERFTVSLGRGAASLGTEELAPARTFLAAPGAPPHESREHLLQAILSLLHGELLESAHAAAFALRLPVRTAAELSTLDDPWRYWVIAPELRGHGEGASGYYFIESTGAVSVRRIAEPSKIRLRGAYARRLSSYRLEDGSRIHGDSYGWDGRAIYAHSIGRRWALGGVGTGHASEYENLKGQLRAAPLVELNIYPYSENASRQLRLAYQAGAWTNWYLEPNRAGLMRESRPFQALSVIADVNQPWGSVQLVGQLNAFLDAPALYRLSGGAVLSLRLVAGLALTLEGQAALVHDQINQRSRPITDRELLLWTAQQPSNHFFEAEVGLSYTFGSVHNTIVNPRFARIDLDEE
jgi:hypothetical protein